eukprot:PhF_6_TR9681/c0_g1_i2/m.14899
MQVYVDEDFPPEFITTLRTTFESTHGGSEAITLHAPHPSRVSNMVSITQSRSSIYIVVLQSSELNSLLLTQNSHNSLGNFLQGVTAAVEDMDNHPTNKPPPKERRKCMFLVSLGWKASSSRSTTQETMDLFFALPSLHSSHSRNQRRGSSWHYHECESESDVVRFVVSSAMYMHRALLKPHMHFAPKITNSGGGGGGGGEKRSSNS